MRLRLARKVLAQSPVWDSAKSRIRHGTWRRALRRRGMRWRVETMTVIDEVSTIDRAQFDAIVALTRDYWQRHNEAMAAAFKAMAED